MAEKRRKAPTGGGGPAVPSGSAGGAAAPAEDAPPMRIKILSMGPGASGKSCIIKRYCEEKFVAKYIATIGVDYGVKPVTIGGRQVRVNFWDLSGRPEFFDVRNEFYKDTQGALLVFDTSDRSSFEALDGWLAEAKKFGISSKGDASTPIIVVGNKIDMKRAVSEDEANTWAKARNCEYYDASAQSGANIHEVFERLFERILAR